MDGLNIDGVKFTGFVNNTSNVKKTEQTQPLLSLGHTDAVKSDGFYEGMGLKISPEARMAAEMDKSPFMRELNALFGI